MAEKFEGKNKVKRIKGGTELGKRIITGFFIVIGISLGMTILPVAWGALNLAENGVLNNYLTNALIGALIAFFVALMSVKPIMRALKRSEKYLTEQSPTYLLFGSIGTIIGLVLGALVSIPFYNIPIPLMNNIIPAFIMIILGYLGFRVGTTRRDEWRKAFSSKAKKNTGEVLERKADETYRKYKILDTSVIIDGRIYDIAKTGFIEGVLLIPNFVLYELQYIADSGDSLKRVRGRRGLDILNSLQKEDGIAVEMYEGDFDDITEVDSKLIKLAKLLDGVVVTNDYNLNKVCEFQNVPVLNINALANAVKPVVIPGETMTVMVVKVGTERQQGVAYLDDGTMIVVEDGQYYMNEQLSVVVTSALQTAAGRMIFAKPAHAQKGLNESHEEQDHQKNSAKKQNTAKDKQKKR